jgi:hypothetical protein
MEKNDDKTKKQCRLGLEVKKNENYSEWYSQVMVVALNFIIAFFVGDHKI